MPLYLDPKNDLVFKKIFGHHPELLKSFLNAILPLPQDCFIESLTYLPSESAPELLSLKYSIIDVRCLDNYGRHFIVEMHNLHYYSSDAAKDFVAPVLGTSRITHTLSSCAPSTPCPSRASANIDSDSKTGLEDFEKIQGEVISSSLSPVYGLALIDDNFTQEDEWFHHYRMTNANDGSKSLEDIQLVLIELPKLKPTNITAKKSAVLWLRFLKEINEKTVEVDPNFLEVEEIKEALSLLQIASYNEAELLFYDKSCDDISSKKTLIRGRYKEGKAEIIKEMYSSGLPINQICQITSCDKEEIQQIIE